MMKAHRHETRETMDYRIGTFMGEESENYIQRLILGLFVNKRQDIVFSSFEWKGNDTKLENINI